MKSILILAIYWFSKLLIYVLLARCIMSWFVRDEYSILGKLYMVTIRLTEPIVEPCRRLLSRFNTGMFDFSVLIAFFLVEIVANLLIRLIQIL